MIFNANAIIITTTKTNVFNAKDTAAAAACIITKTENKRRVHFERNRTIVSYFGSLSVFQ